MQGFLGWVAYLGAANAGVPLSMIVKNYGWNACVPTFPPFLIFLTLGSSAYSDISSDLVHARNHTTNNTASSTTHM